MDNTENEDEVRYLVGTDKESALQGFLFEGYDEAKSYACDEYGPAGVETGRVKIYSFQSSGDFDTMTEEG